MVASITGVVALTGFLWHPHRIADSQRHRSFDSTTVAPDGEVVVTIAPPTTARPAGSPETLPAGFAYESSSLDRPARLPRSGRTVRFTLQGDTSFTYTVTASSTAGPYDFSGC